MTTINGIQEKIENVAFDLVIKSRPVGCYDLEAIKYSSFKIFTSFSTEQGQDGVFQTE